MNLINNIYGYGDNRMDSNDFYNYIFFTKGYVTIAVIKFAWGVFMDCLWVTWAVVVDSFLKCGDSLYSDILDI